MKETLPKTIQVTKPVPAAIWVLVKAKPAKPPADNALPLLNPNQPNHNNAAPSNTNGTVF